jgi:hypothetical protein
VTVISGLALGIDAAAHRGALLGGGVTIAVMGTGVDVVYPVQANAVFAVLPPGVTARLQQRHHFYVWNERTGVVRWMTAFDTTEADIDSFAADQFSGETDDRNFLAPSTSHFTSPGIGSHIDWTDAFEDAFRAHTQLDVELAIERAGG